MVSKLQLTSEHLDITLRDMSPNYERWTNYLTSAARILALLGIADRERGEAI